MFLTFKTYLQMLIIFFMVTRANLELFLNLDLYHERIISSEDYIFQILNGVKNKKIKDISFVEQ